ncbi:MAG: MFS transporter [Desulfobacterales bacterium]|nr:MFS transporter [Desulfobacterales bacterium]
MIFGKGRVYYGWIVVLASLIMMASIFGSRYSYGVFFKSLEHDFGWSRALTSGVFSAHMLLCSIFAICGGWALDRYGPRFVLLIMSLFTTSSFLLSSRADSLWELFFSYSLLLAIGTAPTYAVIMGTMSRWFLKRRATAMAIVGSGIGLGILIMNPVAAYFVLGYGWRFAFFVVGIIAFITLVPAALLFKKAPDSKDAYASGQGLFMDSERKSKDFSLLEAVRDKNFWLIFFIWFLYSFCLHLVLTHLVPHATDLAFPMIKAASLLTLLGGSSILGRLVVGRLSDSLDRKWASIFSALVMAAAMLLLSRASHFQWLQIFAVIYGFFYGGFDPPVTALIGEVFGLRHIGVIMGLLSTAWNGGAAAGPALAGYLFDTTGNYLLAFLIGTASLLILPALCFSMTLPKK